MMELKQIQNKERNKFIFLRTQAFVGRDATTVPEKYKENFDVSSESPSSWSNSRRMDFARNVEILLIFFR
jgi:hypothetical protein